MSTAPTVVATAAKVQGVFTVICPHCGKKHAHGGEPGHRAADCVPGTPGRELGYYVAEPAPAAEPAKAC